MRKNWGGMFNGTGLIGGIVAAAALLAFIFLLNIGLVIGIPLAIVVFLGVNLLFSGGRTAPAIADGLSDSDRRQALAETRRKLATIRKTGAQIKKPSVLAEVSRIGAVFDSILLELDKDPKDIKDARFFLNYVLDTTQLLLDRYISFTTAGVTSAGASLTRIETEVLPEIETSLRRFNENLRKDEVMDLDVTISVLKQTLQLEGLSDKTP